MTGPVRESLETLRKTLPLFRERLVEGDGSDESLRPWLTAAVGLYRREKEMIRPGVMRILELDTPSIPHYDPAKRAKSEGFGGYQPEGLIDQWANQRNATLAVLENLEAEDFDRAGITPDGERAPLSLFVTRWAEDEAATIASLAGSGGESP